MREENIRKVLEKDTEERQKISAEKMEEEYMKERERYISEYVNLIDRLLKECIVMQSCEEEEKTSGKGRLKYWTTVKKKDTILEARRESFQILHRNGFV